MGTIKIFKSIDEPIRKNKSYTQRWGNFELGLITAWESGRKNKNTVFKHLINYLEDGALPKLSFKGGHIMPLDEDFKVANYIYKYGSFNYLAQRQGLLGLDLDINNSVNEELTMTCSLTGLKTIFTVNIDKYKENKTFNKKVNHGKLL